MHQAVVFIAPDPANHRYLLPWGNLHSVPVGPSALSRIRELNWYFWAVNLASLPYCHPVQILACLACGVWRLSM